MINTLQIFYISSSCAAAFLLPYLPIFLEDIGATVSLFAMT